MFLRNSFNPISFSRISFAGATDEPTGRSGYWRLFFYQMQEEALKQYKEKTGKEVAKQVEVETQTVKVETPTVKRKRIVEDLEPIQLPKLKLNPVVESPTAYDKLAELPKDTLSVLMMQLQLRIQENAVIINLEEQRRKRRRRVAAFLLMAA